MHFGVTALGGKASLYHTSTCDTRDGFYFPVTVLIGVLTQGHLLYSLQSLPYASPQDLFTSTNLSSPSHEYLCAALKGRPTGLYRSYSLLSTAVCQAPSNCLMCIISFTPHITPMRWELVSLSPFYRWEHSVGELKWLASIIQQVGGKAAIWVHVCLTPKPMFLTISPEITENKSTCYS